MEKKSLVAKKTTAICTALVLALGTSAFAVGCSNSDSGSEDGEESETSSEEGEESSASSDEAITFVWLPDNSSEDMSTSRDALVSVVEEATGREVEIMTTTDYNVAIEAISSGTAQIASLGAEGYIQAQNKNDAVQCGVTCSDEEGGLDGACYYSRICVRTEDAEEYADGDTYSIENLEGKSFSFVSANSTSGFKVPSSTIVDEFGLESSDDLLEDGTFFSTVMFGDSHQGSAVNLLSGQCDAAAFNDADIVDYVELVEGEENEVGSVYKVKDDATSPFDSVQGEEFTLISVTPVLNAPICYNTDELTEDECTAITEALCSEETANNADIFGDPDDEDSKTLYEKASDATCFVEVEDSWYDPIREL